MSSAPQDPAALFQHALSAFDRSRPVMVMGHFDADGLSAMAILIRALEAAGWRTEWRIVGRGENAWSEEMRREFAVRHDLGGLIVTDLGTRAGDIAPHLPTVVIDHHVPHGFPARATTISGAGDHPIPTSSLLCWRSVAGLGSFSDLLWLAAIGIIGDMADKDGFPEYDQARERYGVTALRAATSLVNAPRRAAAADARPALALLLKANGPKDVTSGTFEDTGALLAAKQEVADALAATKRIAPKVVGQVALITISTPCQIHPLVAQSWRGRLKGKVVIVANEGYSRERIHFAARTTDDVDLIAFFAKHRPPGADEQYGGGHRLASGGALKPADWQWLLASLGFSTEKARAA